MPEGQRRQLNSRFICVDRRECKMSTPRITKTKAQIARQNAIKQSRLNIEASSWIPKTKAQIAMEKAIRQSRLNIRNFDDPLEGPRNNANIEDKDGRIPGFNGGRDVLQLVRANGYDTLHDLLDREIDKEVEGFIDVKERIESRANKRSKRLNKLNIETIRLAYKALETGKLLGLELSRYDRDHYTGRNILRHWLEQMESCGETAQLSVCPRGCDSRIIVKCCNATPCSWTESRWVEENIHKSWQVIKFLPSKKRYHEIKKLLRERGIVCPNRSGKPINPMTRMSWKMISVSPRGTGDIVDDVDNVKRIRRKLTRELNKRGAIAIIWNLHVGIENHTVHLHGLMYSPFIPQDDLGEWLVQKTCTVKNCSHPQSERTLNRFADRFGFGIAERKQPRCNGSFCVHIETAYTPYDAISYVARTYKSYNGATLFDFAVVRLAMYLATYRSHRIQTCGLARPKRRLPNNSIAEVVDRKVCRCCGQEMMIVADGVMRGDGSYVWEWRQGMSKDLLRRVCGEKQENSDSS
jgi:hypothetical protein